MLNDRENECPFCDGAGYILEDKDEYYYYAKELIYTANKEANKQRQRELIQRVEDMHNKPMQPLAIECPKCKGTGRKIINEKEKTA